METFLVTLAMVLFFSHLAAVNAASTDPWVVTKWADAHATFYGGQDASGTMGGACGFGNLYSLGYGTSSTALSNGLFNNGLSCGACFKIVCKVAESKWCYSGKHITVTATNSCPPGSDGGWCDPPKLHFDLSYPMFTALAQEVGGVIPVQYKRVSCSKQGGIRFFVNGNPYWYLVLVSNVGGDGDVARMAVKGSTSWISMVQNWGQNWEATWHTELVGQSLSFRVTLGNANHTLECNNVASSDWGFGQTFEAGSNFDY